MNQEDYDRLPPEMQALIGDEAERLPTCDVCETWTATHIAWARNGEPYLVCDKPFCQDVIESYPF